MARTKIGTVRKPAYNRLPIIPRSAVTLRAADAFTPEMYFNTYTGFWNNLDASTAITRAAQPALLDADMELDGYASWGISGSGGTLSKELVIVHGGTKSLAVNAGAGNYYATQNIMTVGNRYSLTGWHNKTTSSSIYFGLGTPVTVAATSDAWLALSAEGTCATDGRLFLGAAAGDSAYYDDLTLTNISASSAKNRGTVTTFAQASANLQPWQKTLGARTSLYFDTGDAFTLGSASDRTAQRWLHNGTGVTMSFVVNITTLNQTPGYVNVIFSTTNSSSTPGVRLYAGATGTITYIVSNTSGTPVLSVISDPGVIVEGKTQIVTVRMDSSSCSVSVDGQTVGTDYTVFGSFDPGDAGYAAVLGNMAGAYSYGLQGQVADAYCVAKSMTNSELLELTQYFATKHSVKLISDTLTEVELATWTGLVSWLDPTYTSTVTKAAQPNLLDGNMELDGYASWTPVAAQTITKETSSPYEGSKWMKIAYNGASNPYVRQEVLNTGNRYRCTGAVRGDGTFAGRLGLGTGNIDYTGTSSTSWQAFNFNATASNAYLYLQSLVTGTGYVGFDNIAIENLSVSSVAERVGGSTYSQATGTNQPWTNTENNLTYDSTSDVIVANRAKSTHKCMHDGTGGTVVAVAKTTAYDVSLSALFGTMSGTSPFSIGQTIYFTSAGTLYLQVGNGSGTPLVYNINGGTNVMPLNQKVSLISRVNSAFADFHKNDTRIGVDTSADAAFSSAESTNFIHVGNFGGGGFAIDGSVAEFMVFSRVLSKSELYRLNRYLASKHSIIPS